MNGEGGVDDSLYIIPENHPLIVLSENEDSFDEAATKIKTEKVDVPIKRERKRKTSTDEKPSSKRIKPEKSETIKSTSTENDPVIILSDNEDSFDEATTKIKTEKADVPIKRERKRKTSTDQKPSSKRVKTEKSERIKSTSRATVKSEKSVANNSRKPNAKKENETKPLVEASTSTWQHDVKPVLGSGIQWEASILAKDAYIPVSVAKNIITMLKNECTVPFMARYRRFMTENMEADDLRRVKDCYHHVKTLETKALHAVKQIKAAGKLTPKLEEMIYSVKSIDELDFIYTPYKKESGKTKAERARALGLEPAALDVLEGRCQVNVDRFIDPAKEGLESPNQVIAGIQNIMADAFAKDEDMLTYLSEIENKIQITVKSRLLKKTTDKKSTNSSEDAEKKFEIYYNFTANVNHIQPHQILALNRGENLKILSVKFIISPWLEDELLRFFERKWIKGSYRDSRREKMFKTSFHDSYTRLISPFIVRRTKTGLNRKAQYAAIESFASNLKNLLQTPPVKGCSILGIDPGYRHGSKFALISKNGEVLWTEIFSFGMNYINVSDEKYMKVIREHLVKFKCELIAIGNGTGCRNIEKIFSTYIKQGFFLPSLNVQYTIVNERGASIYSCSSVAKEEFPDLDPNLVSAVFIARTLQDPLNEFVKVEPKHLGVGMYQHDMPEKQLNNALDEVVEQCVSFVGVDLNTASIHLLTRIAGLSLTRAKNIIEWRQENGLFKNRQQLIKVKGIGSKTFEQCSGFVRIYPCATDKVGVKSEKKSSNRRIIIDDYYPLDSTCIHPESYQLAEEFIKKCELDVEGLGTQLFIEKLKKVVNEEGIPKIATELNQPASTISLITEALTQPIDYDYRNQFSKPVFRQCSVDINSLKSGMLMTGVVGNVTNFGAFVDIGVGRDGLIHTSGMNGQKLQIGDKVEVRVIQVHPERNRISLLLLKKC